MAIAHLHALPYPAVLYRAENPSRGIWRVRETGLTTPLDRLAQRIALELDVGLVEIADPNRHRTVVTGRCAAAFLQGDGGFDLPWSAQAAIPGVGGESGRLVVRDRAARTWSSRDQYRLECFAHRVGGLLTTAFAERTPHRALAS